MNKNIKICPFCGENINAEAKKCKHCKEWLVEAKEENGTSLDEPTKQCQFCGLYVPESAEKCVWCGEWLVREEENDFEKGNGYIVSAIIWLIMLVIFGILGVISDNADAFNVAVMILIFIGIFLEIYFFPTRVAINKKHNNLLVVFLINLLLGETIIGWIFALIIASSQRKGRNSLF